MSDYGKLVEALRHCAVDAGGFADCRGCPEEGHSFDCETKIHKDAAAAIEALQAKISELSENYCANLVAAQNAQHEPKRGKWVRVGDSTWQCTVCGGVACCDADYCPDCGAKMEVQG